MDNFYVTLPSDSSGYYYRANTIANFTTKLATQLELQQMGSRYSRIIVTEWLQETFPTQYNPFRFARGNFSC